MESGAKFYPRREVEVSGRICALALVVPVTKSELPIEQKMAGHHSWSGHFGEDRSLASSVIRTKIIFRPRIYR